MGSTAPTIACVNASGTSLASGANPCPGTYAPGTPVYVSFYYGSPLKPSVKPPARGVSRLASAGLGISLAALMLGTLLMIAANFTAILCMVVSLGVLVGACGGGSPPPVSSTVTATAPGTGTTATPQSVTIYLQYEQ
jgi:hypothetical protein